jgi:hypothetical protein
MPRPWLGLQSHPGSHLHLIHAHRTQDVLQRRARQANIARLAQVERTHSLRKRAFTAQFITICSA